MGDISMLYRILSVYFNSFYFILFIPVDARCTILDNRTPPQPDWLRRERQAMEHSLLDQ